MAERSTFLAHNGCDEVKLEFNVLLLDFFAVPSF